MDLFKVITVLLVGMICYPSNDLQAQVEGEYIWRDRMEEMVYQADVMRNASMSKHRKRAGDIFHQLFKEHLDDKDYNNKIDNDIAKFVSNISPLDSTFKVYTWQIDEGHEYRYYGFIQLADGRWIELIDNQEGLGINYDLLNAENWYGVLYYNIYSFHSDNNNYYLLFGYDAKDQFSNRKVIDVLSFDESGNAVLGAPVFVMNEAVRPDEQYRYVIEYDENAFVRLNYDPSLHKIVFDHLIPLGNMNPGQNMETMVPDGSYSGFEFQQGKWIFKEKLFHLTSEKPPGTGKPKEEEKRDLFGRKKKQ